MAAAVKPDRGTFGAHHDPVCPKTTRSTEVSAAGQASFPGVGPDRPGHGTRPGLQAGWPAAPGSGIFPAARAWRAGGNEAGLVGENDGLGAVA